MERIWRFLVQIGLFGKREIFYIGGSDVLPAPLKGQDELDALEMLEAGDESAKQMLIEHNLRLVVYIARRFENTGVNLEDLISIGTIGLIKAIDSFKCTKGARFGTYGAKCIQNEILMYFRSQKKLASEVSMNETIETDRDGNPLTYMDIIKVDDTIADDIDLRIKLEKVSADIKSVLNKREREIIVLRYGLASEAPLTQREVAEKLGISRSYVSRIEKTSLEKLRACFD